MLNIRCCVEEFSSYLLYFGRLKLFPHRDPHVQHFSSKGLLTSYRLEDFQKELARSQRLVIITGAGISADSGIPTFRDADGLWRKKKVISIFSTPNSFKYDPASVWEFYHYRRELCRNKKPNKAHKAIVKCEKWFLDRGLMFHVVTSNVDGLHKKAGTKNLIEMHGSLYETRCVKCNHIEENYDSPICEALRGTEKLFDQEFNKSSIPVKDLPHCKKCGGLLRPNVVWFNEPLNKTRSHKAWSLMDFTDLAVIIGASGVVFPTSAFGSQVAARGVGVAEFNVKKTPYTDTYRYYFRGPAVETVPDALDPEWEETLTTSDPS